MGFFWGTIYDLTVKIDGQEWMELGKKGFLLKGEQRRGNIYDFISSFGFHLIDFILYIK